MVRVLMGLGLLGVVIVAQGEEANPLLGCWKCTSDSQPLSLRFEARRYFLDAEPQPYELGASVIRVREPDGYSNYPFTLKNGQLTINFDDAPPMVCHKANCPGK